MTRLGNIGVGGKNPVRIMGILNTSPESFYKKSIKTTKQNISKSIMKMEIDGADFIDIGGMSTAPYLSTIISEKVELNRISKAIKIIQNVSNLPISVDTCRASVAKSALDLGADIINDISGLKYDEKMIDVISKYDPSLILGAFSIKKISGNQVVLAKSLLKKSIDTLKKIGFSSNKIVVDPAIGFFRRSGKGPFFTKINSDWVTRDIQIIQSLNSIKQNYPVLISVSNKSFIGKLLGKDDPSDRLFGSIAAEIVAVQNGADIIRTHNILETNDAIKVALKLSKGNKGL
ncbi:MAG: dihydropteroate synthase [Nitrosopumilus sp.]|nr:dihydropteroate synthase [Nitrosopumilus sp.]MDH3385299.1 dihydropteroate synthase [Nitrosopumilus sp.]